MRLRWLNKTPPLSPPATPEEMAWWKTARRPIGWLHGLKMSVPFLVVYTLVDVIRGRGGVHLFVVVPLLAALAGLIVWAASEKHLRSQHIRWKRVRDELQAPTELP